MALLMSKPLAVIRSTKQAIPSLCSCASSCTIMMARAEHLSATRSFRITFPSLVSGYLVGNSDLEMYMCKQQWNLGPQTLSMHAFASASRRAFLRAIRWLQLSVQRQTSALHRFDDTRNLSMILLSSLPLPVHSWNICGTCSFCQCLANSRGTLGA